MMAELRRLMTMSAPATTTQWARRGWISGLHSGRLACLAVGAVEVCVLLLLLQPLAVALDVRVSVSPCFQPSLCVCPSVCVLVVSVCANVNIQPSSICLCVKGMII